jgi:replicative DNA helicase Mcm
MRLRHFEEEASIPLISAEFLRKYVAYARANCHPALTKDAGQRLKEFYLQMRVKTGEDSPVSITMRQYESLIRLAEASAKIRLSDIVTMEDAQRSINLMSNSLRMFGFEPESGKIDIDKVEGQRMTAIQRGKTKTLIDLVDRMSVDYGNEIPKEELIRRAASEGVTDAEDMLRKLLQMGELYQPRQDVVAKVKG